MSTAFLASSAGDSEALASGEQEHAALIGGLAGRTVALLAAARTGGAWEADRDALVAWYRAEIAPHMRAEEQVLYPTAQASQPLEPLVRALLHEQALLDDAVGRLQSADDLSDALVHAGAVRTLFETHVAKENDLLLPALAATPGIPLAQVLADTHAAVDPHDERTAGATASPSQDARSDGRGCSCHEDGSEPELDARTVPHAIRHATIFGALEAVAPATSLVLVAPHDPLPLLDQLRERSPGAFDVEYLEQGPEAWRLRFTRNTA